MSEGITLQASPRDRLLSIPERIARLSAAIPQIRSVVASETDAVALESTLACLLWESLPQTSWCGFYRRIGPTTLAVGPYQGTMGCLRIELSRGVCGAAARTKTTQLVPDVRAFAGHITCDDRTRSELVIPIISGAEVRAVLDLDSPFLDAFCTEEASILEGLLAEVFSGAHLTW